MILIGQYDSPFVRRVGIALTLYGLPYEHRPWSVWSNADEIAPFNPLRRVPVLVLDDGEVLVESGAILDALDQMVAPDRAMLPATGALRRAGLRTAAFATGLADKAVVLLYEHVLRSEAAKSRVWVERCEAQIRDTLALLERERQSRTTAWWLGESLSHADIAVTCALRFLSEAHPKLYRPSDWPALEGHRTRCEAMPAFEKISQTLDVQV